MFLDFILCNESKKWLKEKKIEEKSNYLEILTSIALSS